MSSALPPLNYSNPVSSDGAKHDKIEMEIGGWVLTGHSDEINSLRLMMSNPTKEVRRQFLEVPSFAYLFNRPGGAPHRMEFRKEPINMGPNKELTILPPLCSGQWHFKRQRIQADDAVTATRVNCDRVRYTTHLDAWLNPTTFARNQRIRPVPNEPGRFAMMPSDHRISYRGGIEGEFPLDGSQNWIPCGQYMEVTHGQAWQSYLARCFESATASFEAELYRVREHSEIAVEINRAPRLNMKSCQTYWEFACDDPLTEINRLKPLLMHYSRLHVSDRVFETANHERLQIEHCSSLSFEKGSGREIVVYAKTNRRIRFEVRHRLIGDNPFLIPAQTTVAAATLATTGRARQHSHTSEDWTSFSYFIGQLTNDATQTMNSLLAFIDANRPQLPSTHTPLAFIQRINQAVGNDSDAATVIQLLAHHGLVSRRILPPSLEPALQRLREAEILRPFEQGQTPYPYEVTPEYREALRGLNQLAQVVAPESPPPDIERPSPPTRRRLPTPPRIRYRHK